MRILLVEDDVLIGRAIEQALHDASIAVDWVKDGETAMSIINIETYTLMLLDIGLPKKDGFEVLSALRQSKSNLPVVIITARDSVQDRIKGLDCGADDYLVKPFSIDELQARIRAVVRRNNGISDPLLSSAVLSLNPVNRTVLRESRSYELSPREYALLMLLVVGWLIRYQFRPLNRLVNQLDQQNSISLEPLLSDGIPTEILPFVRAINELLERVRSNLYKQQRFIADAAHELRTPVAALSLQAENAEKAVTEASRLERQKQLKIGLFRLRTLLNQLLDLARLQSDQHTPEQTVSLKKIVLQVVAELHPLSEQAKVDLGVARLEAVMVVDQDAGLIQLVRNAIDNAIRYSPAEGIVNIYLYAENDEAVFRVEDSGIGIPEELLSQVFQPFFRCHEDTQSGNGLGLAISLEIAQRLGGEIQLENRPKGGLAFTYKQLLVRKGGA